jgi:hypothetical protein
MWENKPSCVLGSVWKHHGKSSCGLGSTTYNSLCVGSMLTKFLPKKLTLNSFPFFLLAKESHFFRKVRLFYLFCMTIISIQYLGFIYWCCYAYCPPCASYIFWFLETKIWVCTWIRERENKVLRHILITLYRVPNWDLVLFFFAFSFRSLFRGHQIILTFLIDRTALFWDQMDGDLVHVYIPKPNGSMGDCCSGGTL